MIKRLMKKLSYSKPLPMNKKIERWRESGVTIGENCFIYSNLPSGRDCFLLNIGNYVTVSNNVSFLQHDASVGNMTKWEYTDLLGKTIISDYCFIGFGSIILPGVFLAKGTIVGAGSVVTKSVNKENMIIAGNPARIVCSVDDYLSKNIHKAVNLDGMSQQDIEKLLNDHPNLVITKKEME